MSMCFNIQINWLHNLKLFTICISDIGPIDLIRMFTFTSVGFPKIPENNSISI